MTEPREMTEEKVEAALLHAERTAPASVSIIRAHISAMEARAERARDAALEEAAQRVEALNNGWLAGPCSVAVARNCFADGVRRLKAQPARRFVEAQALEDGARRGGRWAWRELSRAQSDAPPPRSGMQ